MTRRDTVALLVVPLVALLLAAPTLQAQLSSPEIGKPAPRFTLPDTYGQEHSLADYSGEWVVLEWLNYECPYVAKHYDSGNMQQLQQTYGEKGVVWLAIVSSAPGKQGYHEPDEMNALTEQKGGKAKGVLLDPEGTVGRMYGARNTPQMVVINPKGILLYNGAIDDRPSARPSSLEGAHNYLAAALEEAMNGKEVSVPKTQPYGCTVKYKN
ncbi:MAG: redoxin domain-containing protein [Gemmatimonadales bacterium]|nr:redoxin domain-containing protein [Gemmatimonadales bacterium]NIN12939.1 redoxin domain-containing protein [Gemmatimonadales bacterium]NIR02227.1 redoxin domain-containing protein [Gemmatimonadales bacterium]NIS66019.1 redoxin domain-containing protein [Gemmatimonadales bacterium]